MEKRASCYRSTLLIAKFVLFRSHLGEPHGQVVIKLGVSCAERVQLDGLGVAHAAEAVAERLEVYDPVVPNRKSICFDVLVICLAKYLCSSAGSG